MEGSSRSASNENGASEDAPKPLIKLLIVDEQPLVRAGVRALLRESGIEVVGEATSGREGIEAFRRLKPHVVLMAVHLGDIDGIEATTVMKREAPETAVVILTSDSDPKDIWRAIEAGAIGYLLKGVSGHMLVQAIKLARIGASLVDVNLLRSLGSDHLLGAHGGDDAEVVARLSPRELEVLRYLAAGLTNKEIAREMHYSLGTVKNVVQRTIEKLGVTDRTQAAVLAVRSGL